MKFWLTTIAALLLLALGYCVGWCDAIRDERRQRPALAKAPTLDCRETDAFNFEDHPPTYAGRKIVCEAVCH